MYQQKNILKELLLNNKIDFDNNENDNLKQYLADYFKLNIIPHTLKLTNLKKAKKMVDIFLTTKFYDR